MLSLRYRARWNHHICGVRWVGGGSMIGKVSSNSSRETLRKATSISALFNLHAGGRQQQYPRGLPRTPAGRLPRCWGESGKEEKRKIRWVSWKSNRASAQKFPFSWSPKPRAEGMLYSWKSKQIVIKKCRAWWNDPFCGAKCVWGVEMKGTCSLNATQRTV